MDFVEKQAVHIGYRTLWTQRTQLTIYGIHDILFQFHFLLHLHLCYHQKEVRIVTLQFHLYKMRLEEYVTIK